MNPEDHNGGGPHQAVPLAPRGLRIELRAPAAPSLSPHWRGPQRGPCLRRLCRSRRRVGSRLLRQAQWRRRLLRTAASFSPRPWAPSDLTPFGPLRRAFCLTHSSTYLLQSCMLRANKQRPLFQHSQYPPPVCLLISHSASLITARSSAATWASRRNNTSSPLPPRASFRRLNSSRRSRAALPRSITAPLSGSSASSSRLKTNRRS